MRPESRLGNEIAVLDLLSAGLLTLEHVDDEQHHKRQHQPQRDVAGELVHGRFAGFEFSHCLSPISPCFY